MKGERNVKMLSFDWAVLNMDRVASRNDTAKSKPTNVCYADQQHKVGEPIIKF